MICPKLQWALLIVWQKLVHYYKGRYQLMECHLMKILIYRVEFNLINALKTMPEITKPLKFQKLSVKMGANIYAVDKKGKKNLIDFKGDSVVASALPQNPCLKYILLNCSLST